MGDSLRSLWGRTCPPEIAWNLVPRDARMTSPRTRHVSVSRGGDSAAHPAASRGDIVAEIAAFHCPSVCPFPPALPPFLWTVPWLSSPGKVHCPPLRSAPATQCSRPETLLDNAGERMLGCRALRESRSHLPATPRSLCRPQLRTQGAGAAGMGPDC
ncbi:plasmolipin isoform X2 [Psammomys obesus]|uniref:plasmolipin isoform X2 n=1 Tax=Psammomys obesus TaxID=48139 RepID=UPI00245317D2|nr:plasmolipin isoform X2 [Psammomys obesus]